MNREDAKSAKGYIYFLIGVTDQEKYHALRAGYLFKLFTIRFIKGSSLLLTHVIVKVKYGVKYVRAQRASLPFNQIMEFSNGGFEPPSRKGRQGVFLFFPDRDGRSEKVTCPAGRPQYDFLNRQAAKDANKISRVRGLWGRSLLFKFLMLNA